MQLNFNKLEVGSTLNFAKDFGSAISGKVSFNLNWGQINGRAVDLDAFLVMEARNGYTPPTPTKRKLTFGEKVKKTLGLNINDTIEMIRSNIPSETLYFGRTQSQGVIHHGDDRTGAWAKGEFIEIDLDKINPSIDTLTFSVLSYSGHSFGELPFAEIKVFTGTPTVPKKGLVEHSLSSFRRSTRTVVMAQMTRNTLGEWEIQALNHESALDSVSDVTVFSKSI